MSTPLLRADRLVIDETRTYRRTSYRISTPDGALLASARQELRLGGLGRGSRRIEVRDETPDRALFTVTDPVNLLRDTYDITVAGATRPLATMRAKFSAVHPKLSIAMEGMPDIDITGRVLRWDFTMTSQGAQIARVRSTERAAARWLRRQQTYLLEMSQGLNEQQRTALIGASLALNTVRQNRAAAASG